MSGRVVAVGECMVEIGPAPDGLYRRGFAGDSFNTAWYLRRQLPPEWSVSYATCIGADPLSDEMLAFLAGSGIATDGVRRIADRTVGLYMIALKDGERSFTYWRGQSAARLLAADGAWLSARLEGAALVLFTGITVAILPPEDRPAFLEALRVARAGGSVIAFDPNMRPRLWPDNAAMCAAVEDAARTADLVLPSFEDEASFFGDATPLDTVARYRGLGATTVVVKDGPHEIHAWAGSEGDAVLAPEPVEAVDTTAAGDSFNAGFLAARLEGRPLHEALLRGARLAAAVVRAPGALVEEGTGVPVQGRPPGAAGLGALP